uniref:Cytochrome b-c1 complex subunit 7 n=3 Tax=Casuariiformes TaxID=8784 RepID=A0A8C4JHM6_DRONO
MAEAGGGRGRRRPSRPPQSPVPAAARPAPGSGRMRKRRAAIGGPSLARPARGRRGVTQQAARIPEVKMAARAPVSGGGRLLESIRKWYYNAAGFNKLGLMRDDVLYEDDDVKEALKRLPEPLYNERIFRMKRALDLSLKHQILPKEQWVKYEEDKRYLEPYLKEVVRERLEREAWNKK